MFYAERRPPPELCQKLSIIHKAYARKPLKPSTILKWNGPLLFPECVADPLFNANALRQPLKSLLLGPSPCNSLRDSTWELELITPIAVGDYTERTSQVWMCEFLGGPEQEFQGNVVLKLYFAGCHTYGNIVNGQTLGYWTDEEGMAINEARAYERFKPIQGSQVPYCYGIYEFELPGGCKVKGIVLEDLTRSMRTVADAYNFSEPNNNGNVLYERWIVRLLTGLCYALHQIHACRIRNGLGAIYPKDILVPRKFPTPRPGPESVIFFGFAFSVPLEAWPDLNETRAQRERDCGSIFDHLHSTFRDGITSRWQDYMNSGHHVVLGNPNILFQDPYDPDWFPCLEGEFEDLEPGSHRLGAGSSKEKPRKGRKGPVRMDRRGARLLAQ